MGWLHSLLPPSSPFIPSSHFDSLQNCMKGYIYIYIYIYILYKDVRSCPCEDVHVLWSILVLFFNFSFSSLGGLCVGLLLS
ncbi:hypothetical protein D8674_037155 [Pyrus ussuriensis x Pyrus communis]|uniref:Uncharacterized protein n=1 Tax=Pyrus ussuriensis x Pyrus communis TaxID=2448454 RepID=A0A5N5FNY3_9ROSA|nr:hypothetical protein D8674_037155 [Pyrus ussuriensis x Pyrus communis]